MEALFLILFISKALVMMVYCIKITAREALYGSIGAQLQEILLFASFGIMTIVALMAVKTALVLALINAEMLFAIQEKMLIIAQEIAHPNLHAQILTL